MNPCSQDLILKSSCYTKGKWFTVKNLAKELGYDTDNLNGFLKQLADSKLIARNPNLGRAFRYKKPDLKIPSIAAGPWRKHTNEEIGCGRTYFGRYYD